MTGSLAGLIGCTDDAGGSGANASKPKPGAKVAIISVDGLRPDAIMAAPAPTLMDLASRGASTWQAQTIRPSITLPSHASMVTGFGPEEHGISWNDYRPIFVKVETLLSIGRKAGLRTVLISGKEKFYTLSPPGSLDVFVWASGGDLDVASSAVADLPRGFDIALIHLPGTDDMGHAQGWMTPAYLAQVRAADKAVADILKVLPSDTTIIVTADHGGMGFNHADAIPDNTTIPWIIVGPGVRKQYKIGFDVWTSDTAATAAHVLGLKLPAAAVGRPVEEAFEGFKGTVESCGEVPNIDMGVDEMVLAEDAPSPEGGTIVPGLYHLTASNIYFGPVAPPPEGAPPDERLPTFPTRTGRQIKSAVRILPGADGALVMEHVEATAFVRGGGGPGGGGGGPMVVGPGGGFGGPTVAPAAPALEWRSRFRLSSAGTKVERRRLCSRAVQPGTNLSHEYTATGDTLRIFSEYPAGARKLTATAVYTRQGP